jgi:hypothetical protein
MNVTAFERYANGFMRHITVEHNMWHYMFYYAHLELKNPDEYNAEESYISAMFKKRNLAFFPINRSLTLEKSEAWRSSQLDNKD